jgi:hypothetical protein
VGVEVQEVVILAMVEVVVELNHVLQDLAKELVTLLQLTLLKEMMEDMVQHLEAAVVEPELVVLMVNLHQV